MTHTTPKDSQYWVLGRLPEQIQVCRFRVIVPLKQIEYGVYARPWRRLFQCVPLMFVGPIFHGLGTKPKGTNSKGTKENSLNGERAFRIITGFKGFKKGK